MNEAVAAAIAPIEAPRSPGAAAGADNMETFRAALHGAGASIYANPDAIGHDLLDGLGSLRRRESEFRAALGDGGGAAVAASGPASPLDVAAAPDASALDTGGRPGPGESPIDAFRAQAQAIQRHSLGPMMQTYSFALEATLVTNAATTFTSSVNTLIKTQ
jgi:hypothetical protein